MGYKDTQKHGNCLDIPTDASENNTSRFGCQIKPE